MPIQPTTARARARAELTEEIKAAARRQLAEVGPAALSLRAVARELGMVSSAVYRYFASRDELLTALIVDAYDAVGGAAEEAGRRRAPGAPVEPLGRPSPGPSAPGRCANPHEYALIYGSPVPGYQAPTDTISPATRSASSLRSASSPTGVAAGEIDADAPVPGRPRRCTPTSPRLRAGSAPTCPTRCWPATCSRGPALLGHISFELFGHLHNGIPDYDAFFEHQLARTTADLAGSRSGDQLAAASAASASFLALMRRIGTGRTWAGPCGAGGRGAGRGSPR